jgi:hypothetical protein
LPNEDRKKIGVDFKNKIEGEITKELILPAPDKPNHLLGLAESKGRNTSLQTPHFLDYAEVKTVEEWDLQDGAGLDHGYYLFTLGGDSVVARYVGRAKPSEKDKYLLTGRMNFIAGSGKFLGISGRASYSGWVLSNKYELNWQGRYTLPD